MSLKAANVLLVEDDPAFAAAVDGLFQDDDAIHIVWVKSGKEAVNALNANDKEFAVTVIDQKLPDLMGDELAAVVKKQWPEQQIIFATGDLTEDTLILLLKSGLGISFIPKGSSSSTDIKMPIKNAVSIYLNEKRILHEADVGHIPDVQKKLEEFGIVGRSTAAKSMLRAIRTYRNTPAPTLILGESGTGKELIARAMAKDLSEIIPINCAAFNKNEQLMDVMLFGSVKGAFTDATDKAGLFETAKGRTIFLDEIHHLSMVAQPKLLRVLEDKKVVRVGDPTGLQRSCDFQLILAGKTELNEMVEAGTFLKDLYYRISTYVYTIPSLTERREDIELLVEHFRKLAVERTGKRKVFRTGTIKLMEDHSWPGEVRELQTMVNRMFGQCQGDIIEPKHFIDAMTSTFNVKPQQQVEEIGYAAYLKMIEIEYLKRVLSLSYTQKEAADRMGISKSTLNHRLKLLGVRAEEFLKR